MRSILFLLTFALSSCTHFIVRTPFVSTYPVVQAFPARYGYYWTPTGWSAYPLVPQPFRVSYAIPRSRVNIYKPYKPVRIIGGRRK